MKCLVLPQQQHKPSIYYNKRRGKVAITLVQLVVLHFCLKNDFDLVTMTVAALETKLNLVQNTLTL